MILPSALPLLSPHPEPDVVHANEILVTGYRAAWNVLGLAQPDLHQIRYQQERVWSDFIPLLDAILDSTSDTATHSCVAW